MRPKLYPVGDTAIGQGLCIGITYYEVDTFNILAEHVVYSIATAAANTYYFDDG